VATELFDIQAYPWTIVIDQEGEIIFEWRDFYPGDELLIIDTLQVLFNN